MRREIACAALLSALLFVLVPQSTVSAACVPGSNPVVLENCLAGNPASEWDIAGAGDSSIQGFATDISVNLGETARFKVKTDATAYRLDIYRIGFYAGLGARRVATVRPSIALPQSQPACITQTATGLVDCGNWAESAAWIVPSTTSVSGVYIAKLVREDGVSGASHIIFIVRDDARQSDVLFQTSDTTWQAYNSYGGNSLYTGAPAGRAYKVSYNRPFNTRDVVSPNWFFHAEYPMIRWLEANGYDVTYFTGVDSDRRGLAIRSHKVFLSAGHDEYWSAAQRANVEAARDAGIDLAFFSGNTVFWKTRWEASIDGSNTPYRTLVCYKDTHANAKIDPLPNVTTGTWRDPRFSPPADGGRPENALMGNIFMVNTGSNAALEVPASFARLRFWRNTRIASLAPGQTAVLPSDTLGFEWHADLDNGFRPAGVVPLSLTQKSVNTLLLDYGSTYGAGTATHSLALYRAPSGALVFGAGTIQWSWGLDGTHDGGPSTPDVAMQQATVNLLADMGPQPGTLMPGLVPATASSDTTAPTSTITSPAPGAVVQLGVPLTISGTATDAGGGVVGAVEVSVDGATWHRASGTSTWTYTWSPSVVGTVTLRSSATDDSGNIERPGSAVSLVVSSCPTTTSTTYHAQDDYSSTQGCRNWYYLYGSGTPMTFDSSNGWWQGNEQYLLLWNNGGHPGNGSDAIRRWVAPQAGSVRITGNARDTNTACGGGVSVSIAKNATVLWQQTLANGNTAGIGFDLTTTVLQGDGVNFSINRGPDGVNGCDATGFDPTIVFTPGAPPPPVAVPNVVNLTQAAASTAIVNAGFTLGTVSNASSTTVPTGSVISQNPGAGTLVAPGSAVALVVSSGPPCPTTGSTTYHAQDDFSSTQGCRNWYYLYGSGTPMTFDSSTGWWQGNETYLLLWNNGGHPGNGSDAIRRWVAPQAGSVRITGNARDTNTACGGGVSVSIAKNATVLWQQTLANGNTAGIGFDLTTTVVQNDGVNFSINQGPDGNNACDATGFDPTIVFTPGGAPVAVPNVVNLTQAAATTALGNAGLTLGTVSNASSTTVPTGSVISQNPGAGTMVAIGSAVALVVSSGPPCPTGSTTTYHAQDDFSSTQGCRNWYYLYGSGTPMTFDSSTGWWQGNEQYLLLWNNGGHPGNGSDAIRRWVAPQAGSIRITGNAQDANTACGGGVSVSIAKNATVLWQQTLANGNTAGIGFDLTTTVVQGDGVNFSINRGPDGNNACDSTGFDPTIVFTPAAAPPTLNSLSPSSAQAGGPAFTLTVTGANFVSGASVRWNGSSRTTTFVSASQLTAAIPAADIAVAGTAQVTVVNPDTSVSNALPFTTTAGPTLTALAPSSAPAGGPAFTLTVTGTNFVSGATVRWNGSSRTTTFVSASQLTAAIPAADIAAAGTAQVTVANPTGSPSNALPFTTTAGPTLTSLSPSSAQAGGPAFTLTVTGSNFASGATVSWNGSSRTTTFVSASQLTAAILATDIAGAGTAQVTVANPTGSPSNALPFTTTAGPTLTSLSPSSAQAGGPAFTLTVTGSNFASGATVRWNGSGRTTTFVSASQLTAAILATDIAGAGTVQVTVANPTGSPSNALPFTTTAASTAVLSTASATGVNADNGTVALPAGTQAGDALLVIANWNDGPTKVDLLTSGFTKILTDQVYVQGGGIMSIFTKRLTAADLGPVTAKASTTASRWTLIALTIRNPHPTQLIDVAPVVTTGSGILSAPAPTITTQSPNAIHFIIAAADNATNTITSMPTGYTTAFTGGQQATGVAWRVIPSPGPTGAPAPSWAQPGAYMVLSLALKNAQ